MFAWPAWISGGIYCLRPVKDKGCGVSYIYIHITHQSVLIIIIPMFLQVSSVFILDAGK